MKYACLLASVFMLFVLLLAGCAQTAQENTGGINMSKANNTTATAAKMVKKGDRVSVHYVGKLQNGTLFDTSIESEAIKAALPPRGAYEPLTFTVGAGQMISGFDSAVLGMKEGDVKTVTLQPAQAYGEWSSDRVVSIPVSGIGNAENIAVGSSLYAQNGAMGRVTEITNGTAKVDFNHELAGKALVFTITMVKIQ